MKKTIRRGRKALAATLGALILFSMIFTTGATYFLFITTQQQSLNNQLLTASATQSDRLSERFTLLSFKCATSDAYHTGCSSAGNMGINITNSGPVAIKIIVIIVSSSSTVSVRDGQSGSQTTPNVPFTINPGTSKNYIDTGVTPSAGVIYTIKAISDKGNMFQTNYPEAASASVIAEALITQGVGELQMTFSTFQWATQSSTPLTWNDGSTITSGQSAVIWRVEFVNHGEKDIFLSQKSVLATIRAGASNSRAWYIVNTVTDSDGAVTALGSAQYIQLQANPPNRAVGGPPVTVYFAATNIGGISVQSFAAQSDIWFVMIGLQGTYTSGGSSDKYSQLIPFKSIFAQ